MNLKFSLSLAVALLSSLGSSLGATIPVTSTADSGPGTLREALASALDGDTIDATGVSVTILLTTGELLVIKSVTIVGPGPATLAVDGNAASRVFIIGNASTVSISSLTITNGSIGGSSGGGIYNYRSTLTVSNCTLSGNSAGSLGGGIYNSGFDSDNTTLTVIASTLSGNSAGSGGGGIYNDGRNGSAPAEISISTLSGNSASLNGGGIYNENSTMTVNNCTLSGNSSDQSGGIFNVEAKLEIANSTLSGNSASVNGAGILNIHATLEIGNSILNQGGSGENIININGTVKSHGFNLSSDNGGGSLTNTGDHFIIDPKLGPLADNGGPTRTHLLLPLSPAIDGGRSDTIPALATGTDQRGFARTVDDFNIGNAFLGDGTDIGAVELAMPNHSPVAKCKNVTVLAGAGGTANASIDDGSSDPDTGDTITLVQTPPGPYPIGTTSVLLTVTDSAGASNSCLADVTVVGVADLAISKAVVSGQAKPGQVLIYTIIVTNLGPHTATGVVVNDPVPQGTTFSSASPTPSYAPPVGAGGTVVWTLGSLSSGSSATLTLKVKVSVKGNALVVNTVSVSAATSSDPNLANNTATVTSKRNTK